jgi:hypothetical protein
VEKDVIIGGASGYTWDQLKYWVNSIKKTDFKGDIVLVVTNMNKETIDKLTDEGVMLYAYGKQDEKGNITNQSQNAPHVERFIFIWDFLRKHKDTYRYAIVTDTRDVIFQKNPSDFLKKNLSANSIVASSEGLEYKDEPWGNKNLFDTFGPLVYNEMSGELIHNVGTIAGYSEEVRDLLLQLFYQSVNRPIPIVDQAVYNFLINLYPLRGEVLRTTNKEDWAVQLGTTEAAIKAGAGDIGQIIKTNPEMIEGYRKAYQDIQPVIENNHLVTNGKNTYHIVHQWDRVPEIKKIVERLYG